MIEEETTLRVTEAELVRDIHAVLSRVREDGVQVIVEQDHHPAAVIRTPIAPGRRISECIVRAIEYEEKLGYAPSPGAGFTADVQAAVNAHPEPLGTPAWEWSWTQAC